MIAFPIPRERSYSRTCHHRPHLWYMRGVGNLVMYLCKAVRTLFFKHIATWIVHIVEQFCQSASTGLWLGSVLFFAPNLSVLFLTLFQLRIETASLPKWRKKLTVGFDRDAKVEGWRAMSEEGKYFLKLSDLLFMKQLPSFFSTELWLCPPDL